MSKRSSFALASLLSLLFACGSTTSSVTGGADGGHGHDATEGVHDAGSSHDAARDVAIVHHDAASEDATPHDSGATDAPVYNDVFPFDASAPCGSRTGMRGLTHRSMTVGGLARTYAVYIPASFDPTTPMPFVYVFHGFTMSGDEMIGITGYTAIADREGVAVVFPDGESGPNALTAPWNVENPGQVVCGGGQGEVAHGNDFLFMDAMRADVALDQCIDGAHVFASGFSMGGYMSHHIACYRSDIRAVAPGSGGTIADLSACTTGHVPIITFHGTGDIVIDSQCDDPSVPPIVGFPSSATLWAAKNGCASTYTTVGNQGDAGGTGQCYVYDGCPDGGQVEACTFNAMGHCWAGGGDGGDGAESAFFSCPTYANASELEWSFFKTHAW